MWHYATWQSPVTGAWTGMAKRSPIVDGRPLHEPGEVRFERGETREQALAAIRQDVKGIKS